MSHFDVANTHVSGKNQFSVDALPLEGIILNLENYDEKKKMSEVIVTFNINGRDHEMLLYISSPDMRDFIRNKHKPNSAIVHNIQHVAMVAEAIRNLALDRMYSQTPDKQVEIMEKTFAEGTHYQAGSTFFPIGRSMFLRELNNSGHYDLLRRRISDKSTDFGRELHGDKALWRWLSKNHGIYFELFGSLRFANLSQGIVSGGETASRAKATAENALSIEEENVALQNISAATLPQHSTDPKMVLALINLGANIQERIKNKMDSLSKNLQQNEGQLETAKTLQKDLTLSIAKTVTATQKALTELHHDEDAISNARKSAITTLQTLGKLFQTISLDSSEQTAEDEQLKNSLIDDIHEVFYRFTLDIDAIDSYLTPSKSDQINTNTASTESGDDKPQKTSDNDSNAASTESGDDKPQKTSDNDSNAASTESGDDKPQKTSDNDSNAASTESGKYPQLNEID